MKSEFLMMRSLVRFNPFADLSALADPLFDDALDRWPARFPALPALDIFTEDNDHLVAEAHLPNFAQDDITVNVEQGALVIQAEKHEREEDTGKKYVLRESSTSFYRRIALPDQADQHGVIAAFDKGVLRISVPFKAAPSPTKVPINVAPTTTSDAVQAPADAATVPEPATAE
jgi:HSP20 family protein